MLNAPMFQRVSSLLFSATKTHYYSKMNQLMVYPEATTDRSLMEEGASDIGGSEWEVLLCSAILSSLDPDASMCNL
jgi:hypothetical protein